MYNNHSDMKSGFSKVKSQLDNLDIILRINRYTITYKIKVIVYLFVISIG